MRFLMMYKPAAYTDTDAQPSCEEMEAMGRLIEEMTRAGVMIETRGLKPTARGALVGLSNGTLNVIDGPFAETKELIAGYAIVEAKTKAEAIEWVGRFMCIAGDGETEIRQISEMEDFAPAQPELQEARR